MIVVNKCHKCPDLQAKLNKAEATIDKLLADLTLIQEISARNVARGLQAAYESDKCES